VGNICPCNHHVMLIPNPADGGEGSGDDSGDDGERLTKDEDDEEEDDDGGTVNSPVGHSHLTRIHLSFPFAVR
jgi:hypothetical protein